MGWGAHKGRPYRGQGLVRGAWRASWVPAFAGMAGWHGSLPLLSPIFEAMTEKGAGVTGGGGGRWG